MQVREKHLGNEKIVFISFWPECKAQCLKMDQKGFIFIIGLLWNNQEIFWDNFKHCAENFAREKDWIEVRKGKL